jgi:hypothetical protein
MKTENYCRTWPGFEFMNTVQVKQRKHFTDKNLFIQLFPVSIS